MARRLFPVALVALLALIAGGSAANAHVEPVGGSGESLLARASGRVAVPPAPSWMASSWCATDAGRTTDDTEHAVTDKPDVKVIYAYPKDRPNRFTYFAEEIQRSMAAINTLVSTAVGSGGQQSRKAVRFDLGTPCGPQYVDIQTVALAKDSTQYPKSELFLNFEIADELRAAKAIGVHKVRREIIYLDGVDVGPVAGYAGTPGDSQPGPENYLNGGEQFALIFGLNSNTTCTNPWPGCMSFQNRGEDYWMVHAPLHELFHTLGAVGPSARHASTPTGHCTDEWDVVCGQSSTPFTFTCGPDTQNLMLDCGKDDYFNPEGTVTSASGQPIWNVYDSQFLCDVDKCANDFKPAPAPPATTPPDTTPPATTPPAATPPVATPPVTPAAKPKPRLRALAFRKGVISFRLDRAGTVSFRIERRRGAKWVRVGKPFRRAAKAGKTRFNARRKLKAGRYRLVAVIGGRATRLTFTARAPGR